MQLEIGIGSEEIRMSAFKWNVTYLKEELVGILREKWDNFPREATFFHKLRLISRFYRQYSKQKAKEYKKEELNARAKLELATANLHEDIYNEEKHGEVSQLNWTIEQIEDKKARGATM